MVKVEDVDRCPKCNGETTFGFGLAGGGAKDPEDGGTVPGVYSICLECDWMGPTAQETICFPHGLVGEPDAS
jgi:hypothetical protein